MRQQRRLLVGITVAALAAVAHFAVAQPPRGAGGFGGRAPGRGGRPFEIGKVAAVSEDGKTLTLTSELGQNATATVTVGDQAVYYTAWDIEAKDIAVGDVVALRGTPLKIEVNQAQVGADLADLFGFGAQGPNAPAGAAPAGTPPTPRPMVFGMVNGTVVQTEPLTVEVNGLQVEVALGEGASLTKIGPMDQPAVLVGDRVLAAGTRAEAPGPGGGALTANVILVDATANGLQLFRGRGGGMGGGAGAVGPGNAGAPPPPAAGNN